MTNIIKAAKGKKIYIQLMSGYYATISINELKNVIASMRNNFDEQWETIADTKGTTHLLFIDFKKQTP